MTQPVVSGQKFGPCFGGPANTLRISSNGELGFLWVDPTVLTVWIYNWNGARRIYVVESEEGQPYVPDDTPEDGIQYGVPNEDQYAVLVRPSHQPEG